MHVYVPEELRIIVIEFRARFERCAQQKNMLLKAVRK